MANTKDAVQAGTACSPKHAIRPRRIRWTPPRLILLGAIFAIVVPVLIFGPWLPLLDLVAFVGMYSYPAQFSYGPLHYYTFQFSYVGVLLISRIWTDLRLPVAGQIPFYFLLQTGVCLAVVYGLLRRLISNPWLRCVGTAAGALALWDGVFVWGGPLGYSLGAACLSAATFLVIRDATEPEKNSGWAISLLVVFSLCCHPFMALFALVLCGVRFLFDARRRWHTTALALGTLLCAYVIVRDSPAAETGTASAGLHLLFGFRLSEIGHRVSELFTRDELLATMLFGTVPLSSSVLFLAFAILHAIGFLTSPYIAVKERAAIVPRMLATLNSCAGLMYVFSWNLPGTPIGDWPQRILTAYAPFTYLAGFFGVCYGIAKIRPSFTAAGFRVKPVWWIVPIGILGFVTLVEGQVFRFSRQLATSIAGTRQQIVTSGVTHGYVVVSGIDNIRPFYLRSVPFVLFSDAAILDRDLSIDTEWHMQPRHPSHLIEQELDLGRKKFLAEFSSASSGLSVHLVPQPSDRFPVHERTNVLTWMPVTVLARDQFTQGTNLFNLEIFDSAFKHFNTEVHLLPNLAQGWDDAGAALYKEGKLAEAIAYFEQATRRDPDQLQARINLGAALIDAGRPAEAVPQLEQALRLQPSSASARRLLNQIKASAAAKH